MFTEPSLQGVLIALTHVSLLGLIIVGSAYETIPFDWQALVLLLGIELVLVFKDRVNAITLGPLELTIAPADADSGASKGDDQNE